MNRLAVAFILVFLIGCTRPNFSIKPNGKDIRKNPVNVTFRVQKEEVEEEGKHLYSFLLTNRSERKIYLKRILVRLSGVANPIQATTVLHSPNRIGVNDQLLGVFEVETKRKISEFHFETEATDFVGRTIVPISKTFKKMGWKISSNRQSVHCFCSCPKSVAEKGKIYLKIDKRKYQPKKSSSVFMNDGRKLVCTEFQLEQAIDELDERNLRLYIGNSSYSNLNLDSDNPISVPSGFEPPLRILSFKHTAQHLEAKVYNESNKEKPDIIIDEIYINQKNVTSQCIVPQEPLRADRQEIEKDSRIIRIPNSVLPDRKFNFKITFHFVGWRFIKELRENEPAEHRSLEVKYLNKAQVAVGTGKAGIWKDHACVYQGGLERTLPNNKVVVNRIHSFFNLKKATPTYIHSSAFYPAEEQYYWALLCDRFVLNTPLFVRSKTGNFIDEFLRELRLFRRNNRNFGLCVNRIGSGFTKADESLFSLMGLCFGAETFSKTYHTKSIADDFVPLEGFSESKIQQLKTKYKHWVPFPGITKTKSGGLCLGLLAVDPDCLVFVVVNKWGTVSKGLTSYRNYSFPRYGITAELQLGPDWENAFFETVFGKHIPSKFDIKTGFHRINLPKFEIGNIFIVKRNTNRTLKIDTPNIDGFADSRKLKLSDFPVKSLGLFGPNEIIDFRIPVEEYTGNTEKFKVVIEKKLSKKNSVTVCKPFHPDFAFKAVRHLGKHSVRLRVVDKTSGVEQFSYFVNYRVVEPWTARSVVFDKINSRKTHTIQVTPTDAKFNKFEITEATCPSGKFDLKVSEDKKSIFVSLNDYDEEVRSEIVELKIVSKDFSKYRYRLQFYCQKNLKPEFNIHPRKIFFPPNGKRTQRIMVLSSMGKKIKKVKLDCNEQWVITKSSIGEQGVVIVDLDVSRLNEQKKSTIKLTAWDSDGNQTQKNIAIRLVGDWSSVRKIHQDRKKLITKVDRLLLRFAKIKQGDSIPNWIKLHFCLFLPKESESRAQLLSLITKHEGDDETSPFVLRRGLPFPRKTGPLFETEHHKDQFLFLLSETGMKLDQELFVMQKKFTFGDLLENSKKEIRLEGELSWTVAAYLNYLPLNSEWKNKFGETISFYSICKKFVETNEKACWGTHQLFSLARLHKRLKNSDPKFQKWNALSEKCQKILRKSVLNLKTSMKYDGSLRIPKDEPGSYARRSRFSSLYDQIHYSGHSLEWVSQMDEIDGIQIENLVSYLERTITNVYPEKRVLDFGNSTELRNFGNLTHALSGLKAWRQRTCENKTKK